MPKPVRLALSAVFAAAIGLVPAIFIASPALAASGDVTLDATEIEGVEGDSLTFELRRSSDPSVNSPAITLDVLVNGGTATAGSDYASPPSTVNFTMLPAGAGDQIRYVTIRTTDDLLDEPDTEDFNLSVYDSVISSQPPLSGHGIIDDNDLPPTYAITATTTVSEAGPMAVVTATLSAASSYPIGIPVITVDGTAVAPGDYTALTSGTTIPIAAGAKTGTVSVAIINDALDEADENFVAQADLLTPTTPTAHVGEATTALATIVITDNDLTPTVSLVGGGVAAEGNPVAFSAQLSSLSSYPVTVQVTSSDGTSDPDDPAATAGTDYTAYSQVVTIDPGTSSAPISVTTLTDMRNELTPEMFTLTETNPTQATLGINETATGAITDTDLPPTVTLTPTTVDETNTDFAQTFTLTLSAPSDKDLTVDYVVGVDAAGVGHATAGADFAAATGSVPFAAGAQTATFDVGIKGDTIDEGAGETFQISLSNSDMNVSTGASLKANVVTITDDDVAPTFSVDDVSRDEGNPNLGITSDNAAFTVTLNHASDQAIDLVVATTDGTAVNAGTDPGENDYDAATTTVTVPALSTTATVNVPVNLDKVFEPTETVNLAVGLKNGETDATGDPDLSILTLVNDDAQPTVTLATQTGSEGTDITVMATVTGVSSTDTVFTLGMDGDITPGNNPAEDTDYFDSGAPATVQSGTSSGASVMLRQFRLNNDNIDEPVEAIRVTATNESNDATAEGIYKINDDPGDLPPSVSISDESIGEGEGSVTMTVDLDFAGDTTATEQIMTIPWSTVDGTAYTPADYTSSRDTLTINPSVLSGTFDVPIMDDQVDEPTQTFSVKLGTVTPAGGTVTDGTATVDILDNDVAVSPTIVAPVSRVGTGIVKVTGTASEGASVHLWAAPGVSGDNFDDVATTTASVKGGAYTFSRTLPAGYRFYTQANSLDSAIKTVRVVELPVLTGGSTSKGVVSLSVGTNPRMAGLAASIQQAGANNTWKTVATGTTNSMGMISGRWTNLKSGSTITYRAWVGTKPASGILAGYSATKRVGVK